MPAGKLKSWIVFTIMLITFFLGNENKTSNLFLIWKCFVSYYCHLHFEQDFLSTYVALSVPMSFKVPISSKILFSYLILYLTQWTSAKEKFDLDKMQSFLEVLNTERSYKRQGHAPLRHFVGSSPCAMVESQNNGRITQKSWRNCVFFVKPTESFR